MSKEETLKLLKTQVGEEVHVSDWLPMTQERINQFAQATGDFQWIHTDPARAATESPWRSTIAHGYLTLALYPMMRGLVAGEVPYPGVRTVINYGLNKLRFTSAVRVNTRIRARSRLLEAEEFPGGVQMIEEFTVEVEGDRKPALIAEVIMRLYF
jgi:acyl dehydratase